MADGEIDMSQLRVTCPSCESRIPANTDECPDCQYPVREHAERMAGIELEEAQLRQERIEQSSGFWVSAQEWGWAITKYAVFPAAVLLGLMVWGYEAEKANRGEGRSHQSRVAESMESGAELREKLVEASLNSQLWSGVSDAAEWRRSPGEEQVVFREDGGVREALVVVRLRSEEPAAYVLRWDTGGLGGEGWHRDVSFGEWKLRVGKPVSESELRELTQGGIGDDGH